LKSGIANLARTGEFGQLGQGFDKNGLVATPIVRRTEGAADGMVYEYGAWGFNLAHNVVGRADDQRWDAARFYHMGDETDGLMAEGSIGNQQREIDLSLFQVMGQCGRQILLDLLLPADAAHEGEMKWRDAVDTANLRQLS